jgi:hypothetical protein
MQSSAIDSGGPAQLALSERDQGLTFPGPTNQIKYCYRRKRRPDHRSTVPGEGPRITAPRTMSLNSEEEG